jgi:hypothetical protein
MPSQSIDFLGIACIGVLADIDIAGIQRIAVTTVSSIAPL